MQAFSEPVTVLAGLGFPRSIGCPQAALAYLEEMPAMQRDLAHEATVIACREALSGHGDDAGDVFAAFARRRGLLIEDVISPIPSQPDITFADVMKERS